MTHFRMSNVNSETCSQRLLVGLMVRFPGVAVGGPACIAQFADGELGSAPSPFAILIQVSSDKPGPRIIIWYPFSNHLRSDCDPSAEVVANA